METEVSNRLGEVKTHLQDFEALRNYADASRWGRRAAELVTALNAVALQIGTEANRVSQDADVLRAARMKRFFLMRLFISKAPELAKRTEAQRARYIEQALQDTVGKLLESIDYTPKDEKARKALLKELRLERKELRIQKRDVNASKRAIHRGAKEASANAGQATVWGNEYHDANLAAEQRRAIRRERYSNLAPFEDRARAIEWQLREVERRLLLVERFGTDE